MPICAPEAKGGEGGDDVEQGGDYLVLDKSRSNLALARRKVLDTESGLTL